MTESEERAYIEGRKAFARELFKTAGQELDTGEIDGFALQVERNDTTAVLRRILKDYCDIEDYPEDLYLADVITKYIEPLLELDEMV